MSKLSNMHFLAKKHNIVYCADVNAKLSLWFSSITDHEGEIVEETLWNLGFQIANKPGQPPIYQGYIGNESNVDDTALKGTLKDKKISWKGDIEGDTE